MRKVWLEAMVAACGSPTPPLSDDGDTLVIQRTGALLDVTPTVKVQP